MVASYVIVTGFDKMVTTVVSRRHSSIIFQNGSTGTAKI
jgi:hypothetical protein